MTRICLLTKCLTFDKIPTVLDSFKHSSLRSHLDLEEFKLHIHNSFDLHVAYMYSYNYTKNILPAGVFTMCGPSTLLEALFFPL